MNENTQAAISGYGAFEQLAHEATPRLRQVARRILHNDEDAEDAVQTAYLKAWQNLQSFGHRAALSTWVHRIAVNEALGMLRYSKCRPQTSLEEMNDGEHKPFEPRDPALDPGQLYDSLEVTRRFEADLRALPNEQQHVMRLRLRHDMSHAEIAAATGKSVAAVKAQMYRAITRLRRERAREVA